jgi:hypothetical protein
MFCVSYLPEVSELADFHVAPAVALLPNKVKKLRPIPLKKLPKMCNNKVEQNGKVPLHFLEAIGWGCISHRREMRNWPGQTQWSSHM